MKFQDFLNIGDLLTYLALRGIQVLIFIGAMLGIAASFF